MSKLRPQLVFTSFDTQMIRLVRLIPHVLWGKILSRGPRLDSGHGPNPGIAVWPDLTPPGNIHVIHPERFPTVEEVLDIVFEGRVVTELLNHPCERDI